MLYNGVLYQKHNLNLAQIFFFIIKYAIWKSGIGTVNSVEYEKSLCLVAIKATLNSNIFHVPGNLTLISMCVISRFLFGWWLCLWPVDIWPSTEEFLSMRASVRFNMSMLWPECLTFYQSIFSVRSALGVLVLPRWDRQTRVFVEYRWPYTPSMAKLSDSVWLLTNTLSCLNKGFPA